MSFLQESLQPFFQSATFALIHVMATVDGIKNTILGKETLLERISKNVPSLFDLVRYHCSVDT